MSRARNLADLLGSTGDVKIGNLDNVDSTLLTGIADTATSTKLAVSNTGIDVTGSVTADGLTSTTAATVRSATFTGNGVTIEHPTLPSECFIGTQTGNDVKIESIGAYPLLLRTNSQTRMTITSTGNVELGGSLGIGTSSIEGILTLSHTAAELPTSGTTSNSAIQIISSLNNQLNIGLNTVTGGYGSYIQASDNNLAVPYPLNLQPNGGNVGIGTSSPDHILSLSSTTPRFGMYTEDGGNANERNWMQKVNGSAYGSWELIVSDAKGGNPQTAGSTAITVLKDGNVGIGVTPESWNSGWSALQVGGAGSLYSHTTSAANTTLGHNIYRNSGGSEAYLFTDEASRISQQSGKHQFQVAPSGTANSTSITSGKGYTITATGGNFNTFGAANNNVGTSFTATSTGTSSGGTATQHISWTTAMTIANDGDVLMGTTVTTPARSNVTGMAFTASGRLEVSQSGGPSGEFNRKSTDGDIVKFGMNGNTIGSIGSEGAGSLFIQGGTTSGAGLHLHPATGDITPWRNNARINNTINLGNTTYGFKDLHLAGNVVIGTAGKGIDFSAQASTTATGASATSGGEVLDSYEEGTWTPTILAYSGTNPTVSGTLSGQYTRIGDRVTLSFEGANINISGVTSGMFVFGGAPFAINDGKSAGHLISHAMTFARADSGGLAQLGTKIGLLTVTNGGSWSWEGLDTFGTNVSIRASFTYKT